MGDAAPAKSVHLFRGCECRSPGCQKESCLLRRRTLGAHRVTPSPRKPSIRRNSTRRRRWLRRSGLRWMRAKRSLPPTRRRRCDGTSKGDTASTGIGASMRTCESVSLFLVNPNEADLLFFSMQRIAKVALVTGASSGFGEATARFLASHGFKVVCCDRSFVHSPPAPELVESIQGEGNAIFCGMDTLDTNDVGSAQLPNCRFFPFYRR